MAVTVVYDGATKEEDVFSNVYADTVGKMMEQNSKICVGEADLGLAVWGPEIFFKMKEAYPYRFYDVGIQEADMMGIACGLSAGGMIPFVHSFAPFVTRRTFDVLFISGAYARQNVKIYGSDPGITATFNGGTHMPFEDVGIMRCIPEMTIVDMTDATMLKDSLLKCAEIHGMFYFRFPRKAKPFKIYGDGSTFEFGKGNILRGGSDLTIVAVGGILVAEALAAAEKLKGEGVSARVVDPYTIKPLDKALIKKCALETGAIVTAENHNVIGGIGSAVAETLSMEGPACPMAAVGVMDEFGEVGPEDYLQKRFGLTSDVIVEKAKEVLKRK
jgi:transketolase